jgi:cyanophycin synthetase
MIAPAAAFSAALASGLDLAPAQIRTGLLDFGRNGLHVEGRFEPLIREPWQVVLAWADGPEATASLSRYAKTATGAHDCRRLLLLAAPDNRPDAFLRRVGEQAWGFDLVICTAFEERRGRPDHEVPNLLAAGVRQIGPNGPQVLVATTESEAVVLLAQQIRPGDFCLVSSYATVTMRRWLLQALANPAN